MQIYNNYPTPNERQMSMLIHILLLFPSFGWVGSLIIWLLKKDESQFIDINGKNAINWMISGLIYSIIGGFLCIVLVGLPILGALVVCNIIFCIIAAIRSNEGTIWKYPLSIEFLR